VGIDDIINRAKHLFGVKADDAGNAPTGVADRAAAAQDTVSSGVADATDEAKDDAKDDSTQKGGPVADDAEVDDAAGSIRDKAKDIF
jgi:hypothetical protein